MTIKITVYNPYNNYKIIDKIYTTSWWETNAYEDEFTKRGYVVEIQTYDD